MLPKCMTRIRFQRAVCVNFIMQHSRLLSFSIGLWAYQVDLLWAPRMPDKRNGAWFLCVCVCWWCWTGWSEVSTGQNQIHQDSPNELINILFKFTLRTVKVFSSSMVPFFVSLVSGHACYVDSLVAWPQSAHGWRDWHMRHSWKWPELGLLHKCTVSECMFAEYGQSYGICWNESHLATAKLREVGQLACVIRKSCTT